MKEWQDHTVKIENVEEYLRKIARSIKQRCNPADQCVLSRLQTHSQQSGYTTFVNESGLTFSNRRLN